jgi:hypothetical protein
MRSNTCSIFHPVTLIRATRILRLSRYQPEVFTLSLRTSRVDGIFCDARLITQEGFLLGLDLLRMVTDVEATST